MTGTESALFDHLSGDASRWHVSDGQVQPIA